MKGLPLNLEAAVASEELECILWAACSEHCVACGDNVVHLIAQSIASGGSQDLELRDKAAHVAAVELVACAAFVKKVALAYSAFFLRERRPPTADDAVREAVKLDASLVTASYALTRAFLAQRAIC